jgi:hypothetical protein
MNEENAGAKDTLRGLLGDQMNEAKARETHERMEVRSHGGTVEVFPPGNVEIDDGALLIKFGEAQDKRRRFVVFAPGQWDNITSYKEENNE